MDEMIFDPSNHTYWLGTKKLPGVTSILKVLGGYEGIPERILRKAADRGTAVHKITELDDAGTLDYETLAEELFGYLMGWHRFKEEMRPEIFDAEVAGYHPQLLYAGTRDRRMIIHGLKKPKMSILDIKSSYMLMPTTGPQTAGYKEIHNANAPKDEQAHTRYGLRLTKDGAYELKEYKEPGDWNTFVSCLNCTRWIDQYNKQLASNIEAYTNDFG